MVRSGSRGSRRSASVWFQQRSGMNSTEYKGRAACIYDGWCHVGCPIGALANPLVTYLADARKSGAEVRPLSTATRVLTTPEGTRVAGVEYYDQKRSGKYSPQALSCWPLGLRRTRASCSTRQTTSTQRGW